MTTAVFSGENHGQLPLMTIFKGAIRDNNSVPPYIYMAIWHKQQRLNQELVWCRVQPHLSN